MVNSIRGIITFKSTEQLGLENSGIEWAVETTATTLSSLPSIGEEVKIFTYLHHNQDQMKMYGFSSQEERSLFLALLTVNGVGPSLSRKILSGTTTSRFLTALDAEDLSTLGSIPGLGKKTAQKIVLHLRGKLIEKTEIPDTVSSDVVEALTAMGFDPKSVSKAVAALLDESAIQSLGPEQQEKEILRRAIITMSS